MYGVEETTLSSSRVEKVRKAKTQIDDHVEALAEEMRQGKSEQLKRYLNYFARFHHYSLGNIILAAFQRAGITQLAGLRQWNKLGRIVKRGERGIMILAPVTVRRKETETGQADGSTESPSDGSGKLKSGARKRKGANEGSKENEKPAETLLCFKPVYVFDVSQTEGEDLPSLIHAHGNAEELWPVLNRVVADRSMIKLEFVDQIKGYPTARGISMGGRIQLRKDMHEADSLRVLLHEYAHELLHFRISENSRKILETEADATAYVVCRHFGITCDSADYLGLYHSDAEFIYSRLDTIRDTAHGIIERMETELERIAQFR